MRTKEEPNRAKTEEFRAQDFFRDGMESMTSFSLCTSSCLRHYKAYGL